MAKNRTFTVIATLSLALGIGANSAIFSIADAVLLRPLPVRDPASVFTIDTTTPDDSTAGMSYPDYRDLRDLSHSFDGLIAFQLGTFSIINSPTAVPQMRTGLAVTANFFQMLGIDLVLGRPFLPQEGEYPGRDAAVIIAFDYWRDQLAGDQSVIGQVVRINGVGLTIVGVAPQSFPGINQYTRPAFYVPIMMLPRLTVASNSLEERGERSFLVKGRTKPGINRRSAQAELDAIWSGLSQRYPKTNLNRNVVVRSELQARLEQSPADAMLIGTLTVLAGIVLLIACVNVTNLLLGRTQGRSREIAVRIAVGAHRAKLLRQLLTESVILSLIGGAVALGFAYMGIQFLQNVQIPADLPIVITPRLDYRVAGFSLLAAVISALMFGLAPALQSLKTDIVSALKGRTSTFSQRPRSLGRNLLVVVQVALSMVLLVSASILLDGTRKALSANPGFRTDHRITMELETSVVRYTSEETRLFYRNLVDRARETPSVQSVTLMRCIPFSPEQFTATVIPEGVQLPNGQTNILSFANVVDENYFTTIAIDIVHGRPFTSNDKASSSPVAIVNQEFAKIYWPGQDPVGKRMRLNDENGPWLQVVGVARTSKYLFLAEKPTPYIYLPFAQNPSTHMILLASTATDPSLLASPLRELVKTLDSNLPVYNLRSFTNYYQQQATTVPLMIMESVGVMGLLGLALAVIGVYGLLAYWVSRRKQEISIRMAMGADRTNVLKMMLWQGLRLGFIGIGVGALGSFVVVHLLVSALTGIDSPTLLTLLAVPVALIVVTVVACYFPARNASLLDPLRILRQE